MEEIKGEANSEEKRAQKGNYDHPRSIRHEGSFAITQKRKHPKSWEEIERRFSHQKAKSRMKSGFCGGWAGRQWPKRGNRNTG